MRLTNAFEGSVQNIKSIRLTAQDVNAGAMQSRCHRDKVNHTEGVLGKTSRPVEANQPQSWS